MTTQMQHAARFDIPNPRAIIALLSALIAGSFASIFMKLALQEGMAAPLIVAGRLSLAALILTPFVLARHRAELARLQKRDLLIAGFAGFWLAVHFLTMIYGLQNASVLIVQVIVNTGPIWVALLEVTFLHTRLTRIIWIASILTLLGGAIIALGSGFSGSTGGNALLGAMLSFASAIASSIYLTIGRHIRSKVSLMPYIWVVFGAGSITALTIVLITGTPILGYSSSSYFWLVLITIIPQLIGHSGFNYALGYFSATIVAITGQTISVTAPLIALFVFAEVPGMSDIIGSSVILAGVLLAVTRRRVPSSTQSQS